MSGDVAAGLRCPDGWLRPQQPPQRPANVGRCGTLQVVCLRPRAEEETEACVVSGVGAEAFRLPSADEPASPTDVSRSPGSQRAGAGRRWCRLMAGDRVLLAADHATSVLVAHPLAMLDRALAGVHAAVAGGGDGA